MVYKYNPFTGQLDDVALGVLPPEVPTQFDADTGSAIPAANILNLFGTAAQGISTSAAGNTVTFTASDATTAQKGVSRLATDAEAIAGSINTNVVIIPSSLSAKLGTQTAKSIPFGAGSTSAISWTSALTDGQIVIGSTAGNPAAGAITSTGGSITVSLGSNTVNLEVAGSIATSYATDSGSAVPAAGVLTIHGGVGCATSGSGSTVTIDLNSTVATTYTTDSGTATPSANNLDVLGSGSITTAGATDTVTISLTGLTQYNVLVGAGTSTITKVPPSATSGVPVISQGAAANPVFGTAVVAGGGTGATTLTANSLLLGNGTSPISALGAATNGQLPIGSTGVSPVLATLTEGTGISIVNGAGSITISSTEGATWTDQGSSTTIAANTNYFATAAVTLTLPAAPSQGNTIIIDVDTASTVVLQANAGQVIRLGNTVSSTAGTATNSAQGDSITLTYRSTGTTWHGRASQGNWVLA